MSTEKIGTVRIAPEVLATICALTALSVPGVVRLEGSLANGVSALVKKGKVPQGVKIAVEKGEVWVELHLVVKPDVSMHHVGKQVQVAVAEAIQTMVGMPVHAVDVYIEDVE